MNLWTPEAERLATRGTPGTMAGGGAKAILHVTVSPSGDGNFDAMHRVLTTNKAEPHYLYDPVTDRLGQYFPLNVSSRSLRSGNGAISCNKAGSVVIQIEVVAWPGTDDGKYLWGGSTTKGGFTSLWKPGKNFAAMMRDIAAAGVPPVFPMGSTALGAKRATNTEYQQKAGWFGHCHVPGQDHWDPGVIDIDAFFAAAGGPTLTATTQEEPDMQWNDIIPGLKDADGKPVTLAQAMARTQYCYTAITEGGSTDTRIDFLMASQAKVVEGLRTLAASTSDAAMRSRVEKLLTDATVDVNVNLGKGK